MAASDESEKGRLEEMTLGPDTLLILLARLTRICFHKYPCVFFRSLKVHVYVYNAHGVSVHNIRFRPKYWIREQIILR